MQLSLNKKDNKWFSKEPFPHHRGTFDLKEGKVSTQVDNSQELLSFRLNASDNVTTSDVRGSR